MRRRASSGSEGMRSPGRHSPARMRVRSSCARLWRSDRRALAHGATTTFSASPARMRGKASGVSSRPMMSETTERMPPASRGEHVERRHLVAVARGVGAVHLDLAGSAARSRGSRCASCPSAGRRRTARARAARPSPSPPAGRRRSSRRRSPRRRRSPSVARITAALPSSLLGVDVGDALVAEDRARELEPAGGALEHQHLAGALQPRERRVRGADRPRADHHDGVVEADARCPCGRRSRPTAGRRTSRGRATGRPGCGTGS